MSNLSQAQLLHAAKVATRAGVHCPRSGEFITLDSDVGAAPAFRDGVAALVNDPVIGAHLGRTDAERAASAGRLLVTLGFTAGEFVAGPPVPFRP